jgi:hypothetical protein
VFHVELRYRLPLYPVLLPYAAFTLARLPRVRALRLTRQSAIAALSVLLILGLLLLHRPYPVLAWHLAWKHGHLVRAEHSLQAGHTLPAVRSARAALQHDPDSVLARVAWAQAMLMANDTAGAAAMLHEASDLLPDHPLPHLLLGHLLREQGRLDAARQHLAYETASLQDVQAWTWEHVALLTPPPAELDIGNGLDLGWIWGFHAAEANEGVTWRWTTGWARLRLSVPSGASTEHAGLCDGYAPGDVLLLLRMASGRPPAAPAPLVRISTIPATTQPLETIRVAPTWQAYLIKMPQPAADQRSIIVDLRSSTFTPRDYDATSADGRTLGVMIDRAQLVQCNPDE